MNIIKVPEGVADPLRWQSIRAQRLRAKYWWVASTALKGAHWVFAITTVIVAGIAAGQPGFIHENWSAPVVRSWSTIVAILAGLSGLVPWQKAGIAFGNAHEKLQDAITIFDVEPTYSVRRLVEVAREAGRELYGSVTHEGQSQHDAAANRQESGV